MATSGRSSLFYEAVSSVFREWQALRIAVDNMFGGPMSNEKALWLEEVTADFVSNNGDVQKWELEDYISTIMDQEFNTQVDDASLPEISKKICELYSQCISGNTAKVEEYITRSKPAKTMEVKCLTQESLDEDQVSEVLEDIEEENEVEDEEQRQEEVRGRLEQVQLSANTSCSTVPPLDGVEKKGEDLSESSQDKDEDTGGWEVVRRGRRKSKSSNT